MKFADFEASVGKEKLLGIYLLFGEEEYFQQAAFGRIRDVLSEHHPNFEYRHYGAGDEEDAGGIAIGALLDDLRTPSLFSSATLVRFDRAERILTRHGDQIAAFAEQAAATGSVFVLMARSVDRRKRAARAIAQHGAVVECLRLFDAPPPWKRGLAEHDHPLARWVVTQFRRRGKRVDLPLAHTLSRKIGNDLFQLEGEVEKIALLAGEASVTESHLDALVADRRQNKLYDLTAAVFAGKTGGAVRRAERLFETGMEDEKGNLITRAEPIAFMIAASLASGYRRIRSAIPLLRGVPPGRRSQEVLANELRMRPFAAGRLAEQARGVARVDPQPVLHALTLLDAELKGGLWPHRLAVLRAVGFLGSTFAGPANG